MREALRHDADYLQAGDSLAAGGRLRFATLEAKHLFAIERQESQLTLLGEPHQFDAEEAAQLCAQPVAWAARSTVPGDGSRIVACFGIVEAFPGQQGWGWAVLAKGIGAAHFELTRFVQGQVAGCGLARLELRALAAPQFEALLAKHGCSEEPQEVLQLALRHATPEIRWAVLLGLRPVHVLRRFGADGAAHVLFERIHKEERVRCS